MESFVDNWNIIQTLGEGAYGEVKLLVHQVSGDALAMKIVDLKKSKEVKECVLKEEKIHRLAVHKNIIRLLGKREEGNYAYIFLEYAAGGELFNKIEPDLGMSNGDAQKYMRELLAGVYYLHTKGIAHRDIKPENLLVDERGTLKISDFGMATIFRYKGRERLLNKKCGTMPYVAPEVLLIPYKAEPADLWSCGVVFVAMLAGELPWDEPKDKNKDFFQWKNGSCITQTPWSKLSNTAYSLARKMLTPEAKNRPNLQQILEHPWMQTKFPSCITRDDTDGIREKESLELESVHEIPVVTLSQPIPNAPKCNPETLAILLRNRNHHYFSQPTQNEDLIVGSQIQCTQSPLTQNNFQRLIKRMTRIFVTTSYEKTISHLCRVLDSLHYNWSTDPSGVVTISTIDTRKMPLVFKANIIDMDGKLLLDFRLAKGCGLEFKKRYMKIKSSLSEIILNVNHS